MGKPKGSIWNYFHIENGGKNKVKCIFCGYILYRNATRLEKHLMKCFKTPISIKNKLKSTGRQGKSKTGENSESAVNATVASAASTASNDPFSNEDLYNISENTRSFTSPSNYNIFRYADTMQSSEQAKLDILFARAIYTSEVPLSLVEHPAWIQFFNNIRKSWKIPNRKALSGNLLNKKMNQITSDITLSIGKSKNLALATDSWSNIRNESIINYTILNPKPHYIKRVSPEENKQTAEYLSNEMAKILDEYGPEKFLVIMTDNAANEKKAAALLKEKYNHLVPLGCLSHTLNLLIQDIIKNNSIEKIIKRVIEIVKQVKRSHLLTAAFNKEKNAQITLSLPVPTRWGSHLKALDDFIKAKSTLQKLAVDETTCELFTKDNKAKILDNEIFLVQVSNTAELIRPIVRWIFKLETDKPIIHMVVNAFKDIEKSLNDKVHMSPITTHEEQILMEKFLLRKNYALQPIHFVALILDPGDQGNHLNSEEIILAMDFIDTMSNNMSNIDASIDSVTVLSNLTKYRNKDDAWSKDIILKTVNTLEPLAWWKGVGSINYQHLGSVAARILSMPTSSASTERSFSTFGRVHTQLRNRLTTPRAVKLSFISHNWRLLNRDSIQKTTENQLMLEPFDSTSEISSGNNSNVSNTFDLVNVGASNSKQHKRTKVMQSNIPNYKRTKPIHILGNVDVGDEDDGDTSASSSTASSDGDEESIYTVHDETDIISSFGEEVEDGPVLE